MEEITQSVKKKKLEVWKTRISEVRNTILDLEAEASEYKDDDDIWYVFYDFTIMKLTLLSLQRRLIVELSRMRQLTYEEKKVLEVGK